MGLSKAVGSKTGVFAGLALATHKAAQKLGSLFWFWVNGESLFSGRVLAQGWDFITITE